MNKYWILLLTIVLCTVGLNVYLTGIIESPESDYQKSVSELKEQGMNFKKIMDDKIVNKEEARMVTLFEREAWETDFTEYLHDLDETDNQVTELGLQTYRQDVDRYVEDAIVTMKFTLLVNYIVNALPFILLNLTSVGLMFFVVQSWIEKKKSESRKKNTNLIKMEGRMRE